MSGGVPLTTRTAPMRRRRGAWSRREDLCQPVDLVGRAALGDSDQHRVVEPRVVAAEGIAGMDAVGSRVTDRLAGGPSDADGKLLECCPRRKHELEPFRRQALLRVPAERHAGLPRLAESLRPEQGQMYQA